MALVHGLNGQEKCSTCGPLRFSTYVEKIGDSYCGWGYIIGKIKLWAWHYMRNSCDRSSATRIVSAPPFVVYHLRVVGKVGQNARKWTWLCRKDSSVLQKHLLSRLIYVNLTKDGTINKRYSLLWTTSQSAKYSVSSACATETKTIFSASKRCSFRRAEGIHGLLTTSGGYRTADAWITEELLTWAVKSKAIVPPYQITVDTWCSPELSIHRLRASKSLFSYTGCTKPIPQPTTPKVFFSEVDEYFLELSTIMVLCVLDRVVMSAQHSKP